MMADKSDSSGFPWRLAVLGPLTAVLFALALYFYNLRPEIGLTLLGFAFAVPMVWVVLAARDADSHDSPVRAFVPRLTIILVLGSAFLGYMWNADQRISEIEAAFVVFYVIAGSMAMRILKSKLKRPSLTALSGGNLTPRQRQKRGARGGR